MNDFHIPPLMLDPFPTMRPELQKKLVKVIGCFRGGQTHPVIQAVLYVDPATHVLYVCEAESVWYITNYESPKQPSLF